MSQVNTDESVEHRLKTIDVHTLERAIAKAISELAGVEYDCEVNEISYSSGMAHDAKFNVKIRENIWAKSPRI